MQALINEYLLEDENTDNAAKALAEQVGPDNLLELVRLLGDQLVQIDDNVRIKATSCLSDTLRYLSGLSRQQIEVITTFLSDRLEDTLCLLPVCEGLITLASQTNFPPPLASKILSDLSKVELRKHPQIIRNAVFRLFHALVKYQAQEFISTYCDLASGEKDPENLMLLLSLNRKILELYTINSTEKEDIFDLTFCYFPVTFTPPKNMPYKITAEQIRDSLRQTLISPVIAEFAIPGLISKLTAVSITTKVETLETLEACVKGLDEGQLHAFWLQVWDGVKYEVLHGTPENETQGPALRVLSCLASQGDEFTDAVAKEFSNLTNPKLGIQVAHLVTGVTTQDPASFELLASEAVERLVDGPADELNARVPIVNILLGSKHSIPHGDAILSLLLAGVDGDPDYAKDAVRGLGLLALQSVEYSPLIIRRLTSLVGGSPLEETALETLVTLVKPRSNLMVENFLTVLLSQLTPEWNPANSHLLAVIARVSVSKVLVTTLTVRLYNRATMTASIEYVVAMLHCIHTAASQLEKAELVGFDLTVYPIINEFIISQSTPAFQTNIAVDQAAQLAELAGRGVPSSRQDSIATKAISLFVEKAHVFGKRPTNLMSLYVSFIVALEKPPRVDVSFVDLADTLAHSKDVYERSGYLRFVSVTANKWPELFGDMELYIQWLEKSIDTDSPNLLSSLELLAWLGRGLILRADKRGFEIATYLTKLLDNPTLGQYAAKVFGILLAPDRLLVKENGVVVRQLYKQRLLLEQLNTLVLGAQGPLRVNYMVALGALLRYSPAKILLPHLELILPIILESFKVPFESVQLAAVGAILVTLKDASGLFVAHLDALVPSLLALTSTHTAAPSVRAMALSTLAEIPASLGADAIQPYREMIISGLVPALGDPRRAVRRQATRCRQAYFA